MKIIIMGCGRVGSTLAKNLDQQGHDVTIVDVSSSAFRRLGSDFHGKTEIGSGIDEDVLQRSGIKDADAFVALTNGDNRNIMASQIAKEIFGVKKVICRIYDPLRHDVFAKLGLDSICPTITGAEMFQRALLNPTKL